MRYTNIVKISQPTAETVLDTTLQIMLDRSRGVSPRYNPRKPSVRLICPTKNKNINRQHVEKVQQSANKPRHLVSTDDSTQIHIKTTKNSEEDNASPFH